MILSPVLEASSYRRACSLLTLLVVVCLGAQISVSGQSGGGTDLIGTGGRHVIQGRVFFPSGRRTDVRLKVKLENMNSGDLSVLTDANGSFSFRGLNPGSYTVVVDGGDQYETYRESVYIDTDGSNTRRGIILPPVSRLYTVQVALQLKRAVASKSGVVNAALADVPEQARVAYQQAMESVRAGDNRQAIGYLKDAITVYPAFPLALNELGVLYLKLNQPEKAAEAFRDALKLTPDDVSLRINYGAALLEAHQFSEAETELRAALARHDNGWAGHMYLGVALLRQRRLDEAEKEFLRSLDLGGDDLALPHYYLAGIYWGRGDHKSAADQLEKYLKLAPNVPDAERIRATIKDLRSKKK